MDATTRVPQKKQALEIFKKIYGYIPESSSYRFNSYNSALIKVSTQTPQQVFPWNYE